MQAGEYFKSLVVMSLIAWIVIIFTFCQFVVALTNLLWRQRLTPVMHEGDTWVAVMIPARNEESNIGNILGDLSAQDYPNLEIIVFNDDSSDRTEEIIREHIFRDKRIRLINNSALPEGWLGKNWACHSMALNAGSETFIFLDADVRAGENLVSSALEYAKRHSLDMFSVFPMQIMKTAGEKMTVPVMNYILLTLLPLILVRKSPFPSLAAANGQFMFFDAAVYRSLMPHKHMKSNKVEDIVIARYYKREGRKIACLTGDASIQCRMYTGYGDAIRGFSKNIAEFFGSSLLLAFVFWLVTTAGIAFVILGLPQPYIAAYLIMYLATGIMVSAAGNQKPLENLFYLIPQLLSVGLIIYCSFVSKYFRRFEWKGRKLD